MFNIRTAAGIGFNIVKRAFNDRECGKTQEVELHQADRFNVFFIVLTDYVLREHPSRIQRTEINELSGRDQHAARMNAQALGCPLKFQCVRDQFSNLRIIAHRRSKFRNIGERLCQCNVLSGNRRDHTRQTIRLHIGHIERPADVLNRTLCRHRAEGRDLADRFVAVLAFYILNDTAAVVLTEVHVKVRHGNAFRIQKSLKQQVKLKRIQIGNAQAVRNQ